MGDVSSEQEWTCPACGKPDSELPIGHTIGIPLDGGLPTCMLVTADPGTIDEWLARGGFQPRHGHEEWPE